jgi:SAM-dependent methyltransferase
MTDNILAESASVDGAFIRGDRGVLTPIVPVAHREDEYDPNGFAVLREMQDRHFWYKGRHRFLLAAVRRALQSGQAGHERCAIDLGGGCGGWIAYLKQHAARLFEERALADSSLRALEFAADVVGSQVRRYQVDLLDLPWTNRWDAAFLLDVIEHIPDDVGVMRQVAKALKPGGYVFVTTPALRCFWSYNDDLGHHLRRYNRADYGQLADKAGLKLCSARYFMFFLSPLLVLSRWKAPDITKMSKEQIREHLARTHRVPARPINAVLQSIFALETPLGFWLPFPWGTSILGVYQKPI